MTLKEYIKIVFPILKEAHKNRKTKPITKSPLNYIATTIFYGLLEIDEFNSNVQVSKMAQEVYNNIENNDKPDLRNLQWIDQSKYDPKRELFILEHIYTGKMFKNALDNIIEEELTEEKVIEIIRKNYQAAWITRGENKDLNKSIRGENLDNALKHYNDMEIELNNKQ